MEIDGMDKRKEELIKLKEYTDDIDKDLTMLLQTLQWDRKHILEHPNMITCKYDSNHKVLCNKLDKHEQKCLLRHNGYKINDQFLPDPIDINASTLVNLNKKDIAVIIDNASKSDTTFKRVCFDLVYGSMQLYPVYVSGEMEPLTLDRLHCAYSADERRAIHDAVVSAAPACHDLTDLALLSATDADEAPKTKTRMEILAELRDMRRRRTKYRVAAKTRNYSDVLRDVIKTQMEHYTGTQGEEKQDLDEPNKNVNKQYVITSNSKSEDDYNRNDSRREFSSRDGRHRGKGNRDRERSDRDNSNRERKVSRRAEDESAYCRNIESSRDGKNSRKDDDGYRYRHTDTQRDKSRDNRVNHKLKETSFESKHEKLDREGRQNRFREDCNKDRDYKDRSNERRRLKDRCNEKRRDLTYSDRARNLITEIKREIESTERDYDIGNTYPGSSTEIKVEKHYTDRMCREHNHKYVENDKSSRYYKHHHINKSMETSHREDIEKKRKRSEETNYIRSGKRRERYKDDSRDNETKQHHTEDKHKIYHEVYSELNNKRIKET